MLLTPSRPFSSDAYLFELKHDGYRVLAEWSGDGEAYLQSRNGSDATAWFPEIQPALVGLGRGRYVIDGEVCVLDDIGRADFNRLHARARLRGYRPGADTVVYCVFDLLVDAGRDVMGLPLVERKERLARLFAGGPPGILLVGGIDGEGEALYRHAVALKLEGIVAKRKDSPYTPGARSSTWLKIKRPGATPAQRFQRDAID